MNGYRAAMAAAVVSGYVMGRRKKAGLALALGTYLVGRHLGVVPGRLLPQAFGALQSPQAQDLADQLRSELLTASHAVVSAADRRLADIADALRDRADALTGVGGPDRRTYGREDERYEDDYESDDDDGYGDGHEEQDSYDEEAYEKDGYEEDRQEGDEDEYDEWDDAYDDGYDDERVDAHQPGPGDDGRDVCVEDESAGAADRDPVPRRR
ncbi:hypothetical protein ACWEN3_05780 [Streptomyces sp. NPDC004561]